MLWRDAPSTDEEQKRRLAAAAGLPSPASLQRASTISFFSPASFRLMQRERRRERRKGRWVQGQLSSSASSSSLSSAASSSSSSLSSVRIDHCQHQLQQQLYSSSSLSRSSPRSRTAALSRTQSAPGCGSASSPTSSSSPCRSQKYTAGIRQLKLRCALDLNTTSGSDERELASPAQGSHRCSRPGCIACESLTSAFSDCAEPSLLEELEEEEEDCCCAPPAFECEQPRVLQLAEDAGEMHVIDMPAAEQQLETQVAAAAFAPLSSCSSSSAPRLLSSSASSLSRLMFSLSGAAGALLSVGLVHLVLGIFLLLVSSHYASLMAAESLQFPLAFVLPAIVLLMGVYGVSLSCIECRSSSSSPSSSSSSSPYMSAAARELHEHGARFMVLSFFLSSLLLLFAFFCFFTHEQRLVLVSAAEHDAVLAISLLFLLSSMLLFASLFLLSRAIRPAFIDYDYASSSPFSPSHMRGWGASMRKQRSDSSARNSLSWYADRLRARQERKRDSRQRVTAASSGRDCSDTAASSVPLMSCVVDM